MARKKHKRKVSRIVILTTDAVNAKTRQIRIRPWVARLVTLIFCCLFGCLIGYILYEGQIWELDRALDIEQKEVIASLTGGAAIEEVTEGEPMVIFTATEGTTVVASAKGIVTAVEEDETYGCKIVIDHGNGYVSIYFNGGEAQVKVGDEVAQGRTLFLVGNDNKQLIYQIMKDGGYIKPTDMLSING